MFIRGTARPGFGHGASCKVRVSSASHAGSVEYVRSKMDSPMLVMLVIDSASPFKPGSRGTRNANATTRSSLRSTAVAQISGICRSGHTHPGLRHRCKYRHVYRGRKRAPPSPAVRARRPPGPHRSAQWQRLKQYLMVELPRYSRPNQDDGFAGLLRRRCRRRARQGWLGKCGHSRRYSQSLQDDWRAPALGPHVHGRRRTTGRSQGSDYLRRIVAQRTQFRP